MLYFFLIKIFQGQSTDTHTEEKKKKSRQRSGNFWNSWKILTRTCAHNLYVYYKKFKYMLTVLLFGY